VGLRLVTRIINFLVFSFFRLVKNTIDCNGASLNFFFKSIKNVTTKRCKFAQKLAAMTTTVCTREQTGKTKQNVIASNI